MSTSFDNQSLAKIQGTSPVPLSDGPKPAKAESQASDENKRLKRGLVLNELLTTESTYVEEMGQILHGYQGALEKGEMASMIPSQLINKAGVRTTNSSVLFGNLEELYRFHAHTFHPDLTNGTGSLELIGLCFIQRHSEFLALYSTYCQMLPGSENLRREIGENHPWFLACRRNLNHKLPLGAYLLKPVQRITKYQLLLKDLLKYSEDCDGYAVLLSALDNMLIVLQCVNDGMLQLSIVGYPGSLVEEGRLLLHGDFMMWTETKKDKLRLKGHQRHVFLYQKCILICKQDKDTKSPSLYLKQRIELSEIGLTEALRGNSSSKKFEIWVQGRSRVFVFQAETHDIKDVWVNSVKKLLMEQLESLRHNKTTAEASQKILLANKRGNMVQSKGVSLNGWKPSVSNQIHRPLRSASSWTEQPSKISNPSDAEAEDDASSGLSSEDEDSVSIQSIASSAYGSSSGRPVRRRSSSSSQKGTSTATAAAVVSISAAPDSTLLPERGLTYVALADYNAVSEGEISFKEGDVFTILRTGVPGWVNVSLIKNNLGESQTRIEGWAPATFLARSRNIDSTKSSHDTQDAHRSTPLFNNNSSLPVCVEVSDELR